MRRPRPPENEPARLRALEALEVLDTDPEPAFEALTELAAHIAGTPIALISLVDEHRQWFKSHYGLAATETPRAVSFCGHVVEDGEPLVVADARLDERFADNPLVTGDPHVCCYTGIPLTTRDGLVLGTLCAIDHEPRSVTAEQQHMLGLLAGRVVDLLEARIAARRLATQRAFFQLSLNLLCTADERLHLRELNPAWERLLGWTPEELRSRPLTEFLHPDDREATADKLQRLLRGDTQAADLSNRYQHKRGDWVPLSWVATVKEGVLFAAATDMTEHVSAQQQLREAYGNKSRLAAVVESSEDAIVSVSMEGQITSWNKAAQSMFGYSERQILSEPSTALCPPDRYAEDARSLERLRAGERLKPFESVRLDSQGLPVDVSIGMAPLSDADGKLVGASMILREIGERKRLERLQTEFVSTVSHELRTPLTSIRGSLGLVSGGVVGALPHEAKEYVDIALANSERLVRLINDILDMEKMESGRVSFRMQCTPLRELIDTALSANAPYVSETGAELALVGNVPEGEALADSDRVGQVFSNLISNAAKFSPAGAQVQLSAEQRGDAVRFRVRDFGPGIDQDFQSRVFERFAQADGSSTREKGGTGLGLSISKAIVERMRGKIGFDIAQDGGTTFWFELPFYGPVADTRPPADHMRLLVCEDDADVSRVLRGLLEPQGYRVDVAPTIERARRLLERHVYAAITMDLVLADGHAVEFIGELRQQDRTRLTPIVVLSGSSSPLGQAAVYVSDVLSKPFDEAALLSAIQNAVEMCSVAEPRLLHVEDDADLRRIVGRTLPERWRVVSVATVAEARDALQQQRFDVVLLDLALPDGQGDELLEHVGDAQVVIFSATEAPADLSERVAAVMVKSRSDPMDVREMVIPLLTPRPLGGAA